MNKPIQLFLLLIVPLIAAQTVHGLSINMVLLNSVFCIAFLTLLISANQLKSWIRVGIKITLVSFYFTYLFILLFEAILFDFSGKGFTNEVYFHFGFESFRIGFSQYPAYISGFFILIGLYVFFINKWLPKQNTINNKFIILLALVALCFVTLYSPLSRFTKGFADYFWQEPVDFDSDLLQRYVDIGIIQNNTITSKKQLEAKRTKHTKNLILIYLESFNVGLLNSKNYQELTPQLDQLSREYQTLNHYNSSYVTIEGIISSQCGTMLPMTAGNNTFLASGQLMSNLPCLGDVLNKAGYTQYYLGGAQMEFAGKGKFFEVHEYDHIWGIEHWKTKGHKETLGVWGLSDTQLFKNTIETIKKAAQNPPYNVTALTLGTHLPGYTYKTCQEYPYSEEPFIQAIHCTDQLVGRFVSELEQENLLEDTVLMIVADHGIFPTPKMTELFGDVVRNRKLIAITNHRSIPDKRFSSYDLAPTLLDMLEIEHNANFIYGQSIFQNIENRNLVTRYEDWINGEMKGNVNQDCREGNQLSWPINRCEKIQLRGLTNELLGKYSIKVTPEPLDCSMDVRFKYEQNEGEKSGQWVLHLNDENHFDHFYHKGYLLKTLNYRAGLFAFIINDDFAIEKHMFIEKNEQSEKHLNRLVENNSGSLLVVEATLMNDPNSPIGERMAISAELFKQQTSQWRESRDYQAIKDLDLCQ